MLLGGKKRAFYFVTVILLFMLIISGCSARKSYPMEIKTEMKSSQEQSYDGENGFGNGLDNDMTSDSDKAENQSYTGRKIIKSARIELETTEFEKATNSIKEKTNFAGGYIESSSTTGGRPVNKDDFRNRVATFKLRVPENKYDQLLLDFNNIGNVIRNDDTGADITSEYFDSEARLKSLTIQEERLLEILKKADKITDIIEIERELSNVRYQIENFTGTLKKWDNLVSFSTIDILVHEVKEIKEPQPVTLGDRIVDGFSKSVKGMISVTKELVVLVAIMLPPMFIILIIAVIVIYIIKTIGKKKKKNIGQDNRENQEK